MPPGLANAVTIDEGEYIKYEGYEITYFVSKKFIEPDDLFRDILRNDGCLHVYDLGEGMLVPCQLVDDLFG